MLTYPIWLATVLMATTIVYQCSAQQAEPCPDMRGHAARGMYILDETDNRVFYMCSTGGRVYKFDCPAGTCAHFDNGTKSSDVITPCSKHLWEKECQADDGEEEELEECYQQIVMLDETTDMQPPAEKTACTTACFVELDSVAGSMVRGCADPNQPTPEATCTSTNEFDVSFVCKSNLCNGGVLDDIILDCTEDE